MVLEDLKIQNMTASAKGTAEAPGSNVRQKAGLNRSILASRWGKIEQCLGYKAQVEKVPPHHTSQRYQACGHTDAGNRKTQASFKCLNCGHADNADHMPR